jgi:3-deoxy-manno-octulosonate cytidylyltransferase (CMP-KDO synthetase)
LAPTALEKVESLGQLRWLEHGYRIIIAITDLETIGIDTPEDVENALRYYYAKWV